MTDQHDSTAHGHPPKDDSVDQPHDLGRERELSLEHQREQERELERHRERERDLQRQLEREREREWEREKDIRRQADAPDQNIGALDGKWAFLLKAVLVTTPAAWALFVTIDLPWRIWVTKVNFASQTHLEEAEKISGKIERLVEGTENERRWIQQMLQDQPPKTWQDRVAALEGFDRENRDDHTRIMISLEAIKVKLNIPSLPLQPPLQPTPPMGDPGHGSQTDDQTGAMADHSQRVRDLVLRDRDDRSAGWPGDPAAAK